MLQIKNSVVGKRLIPFFLVGLLFMLSGCGIIPDAEKIIKDAISELTNDSEQWRRVWEETRDELPQEIRKQFDLAFERAISTAGTEFRCNADFVRKGLREDLNALVMQIRNDRRLDLPLNPRVCNILPEKVIKLNNKLRTEEQAWIEIVGYDLDSPDVKVLVESEGGSTREITKDHLNRPTHYALTVQFDKFTFLQKDQRIIIKWPNDEKTVGISHAPRIAEVTVSIDKIKLIEVHDDNNWPKKDILEMFMHIKVNGRTARWPDDGGHRGMGKGHVNLIDEKFKFFLEYDQPVNIYLEAWDADDNPDDLMGRISEEYNLSEADTYTKKGSQPGNGSYEVTYTIKVDW